MSVRVEGLVVRYGERTAVHGVTATFGEGAVGLLGRNGAGKSSILRAILGLVRPAAGTVQFTGRVAGAFASTLRHVVGYMPEREAHLPDATGLEMVSVLGMLSGLPRAQALRRAHEVLYLVGLDEQRYRPVAGYSAGMRQKAKLAAALVHDPAILLLDEPTNGLDPEGRAEMLHVVRRLAYDLGKAVVLSTHILHDVESVCASAIVLESGRVVAEGPLAEITGASPSGYLLHVDGPQPAIEAALGSVGSPVAVDDGWRVELPTDLPLERLFAAIAAAGGAVRRMAPVRRSLTEAFIQAVARGGTT
jgi:ABC-2 type transport system ATP-binding protein